VAGVLEARRIDEAPGEQRGVAVALLPPVRQVPDRFAQDAAGEVGLGVQQAEARLLHDQFQALGAGARIPVDPRFADLQASGWRASQQHGHQPAIALGNLPAPVPGHLRHQQVMMRRKLLLSAHGFVRPCSAKLHAREVEENRRR
jgi:hypothetical protein